MNLHLKTHLATLKNFPLYPKDWELVGPTLLVPFADGMFKEHPGSEVVVYLTRLFPKLVAAPDLNPDALGYVVGLVDLERDALWYLAAILAAEALVVRSNGGLRRDGGGGHYTFWERGAGVSTFTVDLHQHGTLGRQALDHDGIRPVSLGVTTDLRGSRS